MLKRVILIIAIFAGYPALAGHDSHDFSSHGCHVSLRNDTLILENSQIRRIWLWNGGNIITLGVENKRFGNGWKTGNKLPDLLLPKEEQVAFGGTLSTEWIGDLPQQYVNHLRATIQYSLGQLQIKKVVKLYPDCPAIATELFFKGTARAAWSGTIANAVDMKNIETLSRSAEAAKMPAMEQLYLEGNHWKIKAVELYDVTDRFNTLVFPVSATTYRQDALYRGNLLFARNMETDEGFFFQKEAPNSNTQLHYPSGDFLIGQGSFRMIGMGIDSCDIQESEWRKGYGYITGIYRGSDKEGEQALRQYQQLIRPMLAGRDEMVMANTWGDRGQDRRVNEDFCLKEIALASRMGISHFQVDDGWQAGKSANSAFGGTFKDIWSNPDYWKPDPVKFPNGLDPLVKKGKELGVEICLWYNPSIQDDYAAWEKDAATLIGLYKKYGIRTFKIDGTNIPNKEAEIHLRKLYERVMEATGWAVILNLDATAGRRGGYFYFNEYGNFFLENRYTDWGNYYPYRTLRNLWMLSQYLPPQGLQIEFLNKWRNFEKYKNDTFAPGNYSLDYLFAITMVAQPLAWMEMANLPEEAFTVAKTIKKYREIQSDLHKGTIFPIGSEPDGRSWCGFQSSGEISGYFLIFRENNQQRSMIINTRLGAGKEIVLTPVLGDAKAFVAKTNQEGAITFSLTSPNSFALWKYRCK
jgi:alpha-galactosidase